MITDNKMATPAKTKEIKAALKALATVTVQGDLAQLVRCGGDDVEEVFQNRNTVEGFIEDAQGAV